ncbi:MAG: class I SAM-dependent methyltransferase [Planctomycetota bacterium]
MKQSLSHQEIHELFADGIIRHGPFAGLKYPALASIGSALYPKLLGSYESEIHPWIQEVCDAGYSEIIDVGCAEGYYAVGLARRIPQATVYAYDTDEGARQLCAHCATANQVADRLSVRAAFTADELPGIPIRQRGLIICDCEGGEIQIFTEQTRQRFANWDLLIETHDFMDITISTRLAELFQDTHQLRTLTSLDDIQKAKTYDYPELSPFDLATRRTILAEYRPTIMEWLFLTSRSQST